MTKNLNLKLIYMDLIFCHFFCFQQKVDKIFSTAWTHCLNRTSALYKTNDDKNQHSAIVQICDTAILFKSISFDKVKYNVRRGCVALYVLNRVKVFAKAKVPSHIMLFHLVHFKWLIISRSRRAVDFLSYY